MPMLFYLPLIIARGVLSISSEALEASDAYVRQPKPRTVPPYRTTQPGFDQPWLASKNPALR